MEGDFAYANFHKLENKGRIRNTVLSPANGAFATRPRRLVWGVKKKPKKKPGESKNFRQAP